MELFLSAFHGLSRVAQSLVSALWHCGVDGPRESCCTSRLSEVLDWEFWSFYLSLKYKPAE